MGQLENGQTKARFVVCDDDPEMRALLRSMLRPLDVSIVEVGGGAELLAALADAAEPFDLVITDVRMPAPSGLHVVSMARAAGLETPFVVITAFPDEQLRRSVSDIGGSLLLEKPFERVDLLTAVRSLLAGRLSVEGSGTHRIAP